MRKKTTGAILLAIFLPTLASAHEGHVHRIAGTVASVEAGQLTVRATDGKTVRIELDSETRYRKGEQAATLQDVEPGKRVVVEVEEHDGVLHARKVQFTGAARAETP